LGLPLLTGLVESLHGGHTATIHGIANERNSTEINVESINH
jgi:hypothetical protein